MLTITIHPRSHNFRNRIKQVIPDRAIMLAGIKRDWNIPEDVVEHRLLQYFCLRWQGKWLENKIAKHQNGTIEHNGVIYHVIWYQCHPIDCYESERVMLSFRQCKHEFSHVNYVLAKPVA